MASQFLRQWRAESAQQHDCFDACLCALLQCVAEAPASHAGGMRLLRAAHVRLALSCVAHPDAAGLVLRCLLALQQSSDSKAGALWPA